MATVNNGQYVVQTIKLTKVFKDFWGRDKVVAVDNLDLQISSGEVFGLLGPNGSGKTTTIKMLLGLLYPTGGQGRIFGRIPTDVSIKSRIGYLPEDTTLYQFLDCWETLDFYGRLFGLGSSQRRSRAESLIEMVGLGLAARRQVGQYSKGMARRIGLAQSLINDPDLLILDEPTAGMDPIGTRQIKDLIIELKRRGKTILLSSHLLADVEDVCDRIAILYGGKLLCCGPVNQLLSQEKLTQIVVDKLDDKELAELQDQLQRQLGRQIISVSSPKDRLEEFFLKMVQQAQEQLPTSGALLGTAVGEFLRASTPAEPTEQQVLEELVAAADKPAAPAQQDESTPKAPVQDRPQVAKDVLEQLVKHSAEPASGPEKQSPPKQIKRDDKKQIDKSILEQLTGRDSDSSDSHAGPEESSDASDLGHS